MSRFLSIDWDHDRLYLVALSAGRGKVRIEKAVSFDEPHTLDPAQAEAAGARLRQRLKAEKLAAAPLLASVGRERVVFKEVRYPAVAPKDEPAVVRFQATKELSEPANRVVIDYAPLGPVAGNGEQRAIVSVARLEWLRGLQALCKGAGLKLAAVTPRPFGIAACLQHLSAAAGLSAPSPPLGATVAVVVLSKSWAEFAIVRNGSVLFSRPLPQGDVLLGDIRRNLALFAGQVHVTPASGSPVQSLYFAGDSAHAVLKEKLQETLAIPVHEFDPFGSQELVSVSGDRGGFVGAVGLAQQFAHDGKAPVNFALPKEAKADTGSRRQHLLVTAGLVAVLLIVCLVGATLAIGVRRSELEDRRSELTAIENRLKLLEPEAKKLAELRAWSDSALPWIDEIYELTERFPQQVGFKVTAIDINPIATRKPNEPYTMRMTIKGVAPEERVDLVRELRDRINKDKYSRATLDSQKLQGSADKKGKETHEFVLLVDVAPGPVTDTPSAAETKPTPAPGKKRKLKR